VARNATSQSEGQFSGRDTNRLARDKSVYIVNLLWTANTDERVTGRAVMQ